MLIVLRKHDPRQSKLFLSALVLSNQLNWCGVAAEALATLCEVGFASHALSLLLRDD
jgi:hypothetical protein